MGPEMSCLDGSAVSVIPLPLLRSAPPHRCVLSGCSSVPGSGSSPAPTPPRPPSAPPRRPPSDPVSRTETVCLSVVGRFLSMACWGLAPSSRWPRLLPFEAARHCAARVRPFQAPCTAVSAAWAAGPLRRQVPLLPLLSFPRRLVPAVAFRV